MSAPLPVFPYQETGGDWMAHRARCGLLDVPGLGKTAQTIRAVDLRRLTRGVVICPAHLRENWLGEFRKFSYFERRIVKGQSLHDFVAWSRGVFDIIVVSYELATKWAPHFHEHGEPLEFLAMDEAHYLANLGTQRTTAILGLDGDGAGGLAQLAMQSWWITGTLMTNDPANCYTFLRFCNAHRLTYGAFVKRFFFSRNSVWGQRNKPKPERLPELQQLIVNNSIRRTFDDVGIELPPIYLTTTLVDGDNEAVRLLLAQHPGLDRAIISAVDSGGLSFLDSQHVATLRRLIAEAKAVPYAEMLLGELHSDPDRKMVVMGISRGALQTVHGVLLRHRIGAVIVQGGVSESQRIEAIGAFQNDAGCRVFVGNIKAAGTGLTLTAAAHIDVLEPDWTPAGNDQAIKRIRRLGQTRTQHARFITLARSFDEVVNRIIIDKTKAIAMVEGDMMLSPPAGSLK